MWRVSVYVCDEQQLHQFSGHSTMCCRHRCERALKMQPSLAPTLFIFAHSTASSPLQFTIWTFGAIICSSTIRQTSATCSTSQSVWYGSVRRCIGAASRHTLRLQSIQIWSASDGIVWYGLYFMRKRSFTLWLPVVTDTNSPWWMCIGRNDDDDDDDEVVAFYPHTNAATECAVQQLTGNSHTHTL